VWGQLLGLPVRLAAVIRCSSVIAFTAGSSWSRGRDDSSQKHSGSGYRLWFYARVGKVKV